MFVFLQIPSNALAGISSERRGIIISLSKERDTNDYIQAAKQIRYMYIYSPTKPSLMVSKWMWDNCGKITVKVLNYPFSILQSENVDHFSDFAAEKSWNLIGRVMKWIVCVCLHEKNYLELVTESHTHDGMIFTL